MLKMYTVYMYTVCIPLRLSDKWHTTVKHETIIYIKCILLLHFFSGLSGASIGFTFGMITKKHPIVYSLSTGLGVFAISGVFFGESSCHDNDAYLLNK